MNIYFSGLAGVGIGPLAQIARDAGHTVIGSDIAHGLTTEELENNGIVIHYGQDGSFLRESHQTTPLDWFVYTAALPADHPELLAAKELGIRTSKRDEFLAYFIKQHNLKLIAVSGTHGKTTTTGMAVWAFKHLGIPVSYSVGSTITFGASGAYDIDSEYFIYECDEYDKNLLHFSPFLSLLTSIDYDHPDTYPTEEDYKATFRQYIAQSNLTIAWQQDLDYIEQPANDSIWALDPEQTIDVDLLGEHNRRNATLVSKALENLGLADKERSIEALATFPGTDRRFEKLADNLYSDYGHHPEEIAATLQLAREASEEIVLVYQPHQNWRQHFIRDQYTDQFEVADKVFWLPTYLTRENSDQTVLTPQELTTNITNKDALEYAELNHALWNEIQKARESGALVLTMGAGTIDSWVREQLNVARTAAVTLVDTHGNLLLQKRDDKPGINNPGMLTAFGGAIEGEETNREGALRELSEETNIDPSWAAENLEYLVTVYQPTTIQGIPRYITYYTLRGVDASTLEVYEGQGFEVVSPTSDTIVTLNLSEPTIEMLEAYNA